MTTSLSPIPSWFVGAARLVLAVAVVLMTGAMAAPHVDAVKSNGKTNVSIRDRVMAQENLCTVEGGTFSMSRNAFGSTVTTCTGGSEGDWKCTNSKKRTSCHPLFTPLPPDDDANPSPAGDNPPTGDGGGTPDGDGSGGLTPPGISPGQPSISDGGGVTLASFRDSESARDKHDDRHQRQEHGKKQKG